jgi:hypothetical protein
MFIPAERCAKMKDLVVSSITHDEKEDICGTIVKA